MSTITLFLTDDEVRRVYQALTVVRNGISKKIRKNQEELDRLDPADEIGRDEIDAISHTIWQMDTEMKEHEQLIQKLAARM